MAVPYTKYHSQCMFTILTYIYACRVSLTREEVPHSPTHEEVLHSPTHEEVLHSPTRQVHYVGPAHEIFHGYHTVARFLVPWT